VARKITEFRQQKGQADREKLRVFCRIIPARSAYPKRYLLYAHDYSIQIFFKGGFP